MQLSTFNAFPVKFLQVDVNDTITYGDKNQLVEIIDDLIKNNPGAIGSGSPRIQSRTFLFDDGCPAVMSVLKKTFIDACEEYLKSSGIKNIKQVGTRAWFFKTWKELDQDINWHTHSPAILSGVFYLKGFNRDTPSTLFKNPVSSIFDQGSVSFPVQEGTWIIFPSHLSHTNGKITSDIPRYVIAADYFGIIS